MLTSEDLEHMTVEILTGRTPTLRTPEADAIRMKIAAECAAIKAKGGEVLIPHEIPAPGGEVGPKVLRGAPVVREVHFVTAAGAEIRTATFEGAEHLVVPVVALVEGVIHAVNAPRPELVLAQEFALGYQGWNGRPVVADHPTRNGIQVSANDPVVLESECIGRVFNARLDGKRLLMEAWINTARAALSEKGRTLVARLRARRPVEVSVGTFVVAETSAGSFGEKPYSCVWRQIMPDHLAMLPEGHTGACSIEMGCGAMRANAGAEARVGAGFDEVQHPRDESGKWTDGGGSGQPASGGLADKANVPHPQGANPQIDAHGNVVFGTPHGKTLTAVAKKATATAALAHAAASGSDNKAHVEQAWKAHSAAARAWRAVHNATGTHKAGRKASYHEHQASQHARQHNLLLQSKDVMEFAEESSMALETLDGGPGPGNWGHKGRPGEVGGSAPGDDSPAGSSTSLTKVGKAILGSKAQSMSDGSVKWSKDGGHPHVVIARIMDKLKKHGYKQTKSYQNWVPDGSDNVTNVREFAHKNGSTAIMESYYGQTKADNSYAVTIKPPPYRAGEAANLIGEGLLDDLRSYLGEEDMENTEDVESREAAKGTMTLKEMQAAYDEHMAAMKKAKVSGDMAGAKKHQAMADDLKAKMDDMRMMEEREAAGFDESQHPRAKDGEFSGGGDGEMRAAFGEAEAAEEQAELISYQTLASMLAQAFRSLTEAAGMVKELIAGEQVENATQGYAEEQAETTLEEARMRSILALTAQACGSIRGVEEMIRSLLADSADGTISPMGMPGMAMMEGRDAVGARHSSKDQEMLQQMHDHSVALGAACAPKAAAAAPPTTEPRAACSCAAGPTEGETNMTKTERVRALIACPATPWTDDDQTYLETQSDERLSALESHRNSALKAAEEKAASDAEIAKLKVAAETEAAKIKAEAETAKPQTEDEYLAAAPESIKQVVSKHKAAEAARKTELVSTLKAAQSEFTEDELKARSVDDLERLARVAKAAVPAIDYTLRGTPRAAEQSNAVPPPPSVDARILAARQ